MKTILAVLLGIGFVLVQSVSLAEETAERELQLSIQSKSLRDALNDWAQQTGLQLVSEITGEFVAPRVEGRLTPRAALEKLLAGTPLKYEWLSDGVVAVRQPQLLPARLQTSGVNSNSKSPSVSRFSSSAEEEQLVLANAQEAGGERAATVRRGDIEEVEEVIVVGSHIRGAHPQSAAVSVFTAQEIRATGATTLEAFINRLPQNVPTLSGAPTLFAGNRLGTNVNATASVDIRGLGIGTTLILINGHRIAPSANGRTPDISLIPLSAIQRVEVLTDGASAVYGADAIGGVVNFVLRDDPAIETVLGYGGVTEGDLRETRLEQSLGTSWDSGRVLVSYSYFDRTALDAQDRDFASASARFDLFPDDTRHGAMLSARQESPIGNLFTDFLYSKRENQAVSNRAFVIPGLLLTSDTTNQDEQYVGSVGLDREISDDLAFNLTGSYGHASTDQEVDTTFFGLTFPFEEKSEASTLDVSAKLDGSFLTMPGGTAKYSVGLGYTEDTFKLVSRLDRNTKYGFAEVLLPIVGKDQDVPLVNRMELNLAGRYSEFSDFGSNFSSRIGLFWSFTDSFSVRGTYSESFKAPYLAQLNTNDNSFQLASPTTLFVQGNNANLDAETADAFTVGFNLRLEHFDFAVTYFDISYDDRIEHGDPTGGFAVLTSPASFPDLLIQNPTAAQISELLQGATLIPGSNTFGIDVSDPNALAAATDTAIDNRLRNLGTSDLSALDFAANYRTDFGNNALRFGVLLTYLLDGEQKTTPSAPAIETIDTVLRPSDLKSRAYIGLSNGGLDAQLGINYVDDYRDPYAPTPTTVDSWTTLDLTLRYSFQSPMLQGTSLALLAQNITDEDPPHVQLSSPGQQAITEPVGFDPVNATPLGRFISIELRKRW